MVRTIHAVSLKAGDRGWGDSDRQSMSNRWSLSRVKGGDCEEGARLGAMGSNERLPPLWDRLTSL
eukprot:3936493-Rhodomonas_salina.4